jgi:hypothetical protein
MQHRNRCLLIINAMSLWPSVGLGGEWGGAVLLAIENAPPKRVPGTVCFRN